MAYILTMYAICILHACNNCTCTFVPVHTYSKIKCNINMTREFLKNIKIKRTKNNIEKITS